EVLATSRAERLHLIGYCSGATLVFARLAAWPHRFIASFTSIAGPIDLAVPSVMHTLMTHRALKPAMLLDGSSRLPAAAVRESFHLLRPAALRAIARGRAARRDPVEWARYAALARWGWEQRPLPGGLVFDSVGMVRPDGLY